YIGTYLDGAKPDVESVGEEQQLARCEIRLDRATVDLGLRRVGHQNHDDVGPRCDVGDAANRETRRARFLARPAVRVQPDADAHATVAQIECVRVSLRTVPNDANLFRTNDFEVSIFVVIHRSHALILQVGTNYHSYRSSTISCFGFGERRLDAGRRLAIAVGVAAGQRNA